MAEITIKEKEIQFRGLTKKEIRELKSLGFTTILCNPLIDQADEAMDKVFEKVLKQDIIEWLEDRPPKDSLKLWKNILKETYGATDEEKNLQSTSAGSQTKSE